MQLSDLPSEILARIFHGPGGNLFYHGHVLNKQFRQIMLKHTRSFPQHMRALFEFERLARGGLYSEVAMCSLLQDDRLCVEVFENEETIFEAVECWMAKNEEGEELLLKLVRFDLMRTSTLDRLIDKSKSESVRALALLHRDASMVYPKAVRGPPTAVHADFVYCMHGRSPHVFLGLRGSILVCDETTLEVIKTLECDGIVNCMTSYVMPWGSTGLVTGHWYPHNCLHVWDLAIEEEDALVPEHLHGVRCCEMSSCQQYLVSASEDKTIKIWRISRLTNYFELVGTINVGSVVYSLSVAFEGFIISGRNDGNITVYKLHTQKRVWTMRVHTQMVSALTIVDNKTLISASADGSVVASELGGRWCFLSRIKVPHLSRKYGGCSSLAYLNGTLLCGCYYNFCGFVVALEAKTLRWRHTLRLPYHVSGLLGTLVRYAHGEVVRS